MRQAMIESAKKVAGFSRGASGMLSIPSALLPSALLYKLG
jgi:hypothetical protein